MESLDVYKILSYGAIGLGCILAFFAYQLLRHEQGMTQPRKQILTSIYVFMVFSMALSALGFFAEQVKDRTISEYKVKYEKERDKILGVAQSLSVVLEQKEVAALESNASPEIQRHIIMLRRSLEMLRGSSS